MLLKKKSSEKNILNSFINIAPPQEQEPIPEDLNFDMIYDSIYLLKTLKNRIPENIFL